MINDEGETVDLYIPRKWYDYLLGAHGSLHKHSLRTGFFPYVRNPDLYSEYLMCLDQRSFRNRFLCICSFVFINSRLRQLMLLCMIKLPSVKSVVLVLMQRMD